MTLRRLVVRSAALLLLAMPCAVEARAQEPQLGPPASARPVHEDRDYCFRLTAPSRSWRLLDEAKARGVYWDAVAGMADLDGTYCVVVVQPLAVASLDEFVARKKSDLERDLEAAASGPIDRSPFCELPARRWETTGRYQGIPLRHRHLHIERGGFCYQLIAWQRATEPITGELADLDTLARHFEMTEGEPRARAWTGGVLDARGVGWRIEAGVYQDAVRGIEIRPAEGWSLLIGDELAADDDEAFVGLQAEGGQIGLTLYDQVSAGVPDTEHEAALRAEYEEHYGDPVAGEPMAATIAGLDFALREWAPGESQTMRAHFGARVAGGRALQVVAWYDDAAAKRARELLPAAFRSITALDPAARDALARSLVAEGDPEVVVALDYSLQRGVYRDFARRLAWKKPAGWWEIDFDGAEDTDDGKLFTFRDLASGVTGTLHEWEAGDASLEAFHRTLVERLQPKDPIPPPTPVDLGGVAALATEVRPGYVEEPFHWTVVTALRDGIAYELAIHAREATYEAARASVAAATTALRLPARLAEREWIDGSYINRRFGFRFDPPASATWSGQEVAPTDMEQVATLVTFSSDDYFCYIGAVDEAFVGELALDSLLRRLSPSEHPRFEPAEPFRGGKATRFKLRGAARIAGWFAQRGDSLRFVVAGARKVDVDLDLFLACFHELDD